jgi:hypothetical protein
METTLIQDLPSSLPDVPLELATTFWPMVTNPSAIDP